MSLECPKNKERNPFTKKCVRKCRKGSKRITNRTKRKFVCLKACRKGFQRNSATNRCKRRSIKKTFSPSPADSSYFTPLEGSPLTLDTIDSEYYTPQTKPKSSLVSLKYFHDTSPYYSKSNEMRKKKKLKKEPSISPSLKYFHDTSPNYSKSNPMRLSARSLSSSPSLEYFYDNSPDRANENEMMGNTPSISPSSSKSLEYFYDDKPDFANMNEMRN